jgi:predicted ester cyclase
MLEAQYGAFPDWHVVLNDQFATDDRVACRWHVSRTHNGDSLGFPATRRHVEYAGVSVWEFEAGKARRGWIFADVPSLLAQLTEPTNG